MFLFQFLFPFAEKMNLDAHFEETLIILIMENRIRGKVSSFLKYLQNFTKLKCDLAKDYSDAFC